MAVLTGLGVWIAGAADSAWFNPAAEARQRVAVEALTDRGTDTDMVARLEQESVRTEAYWTRYPDVAADPYFGRAGRLGRFGAREHYLRHGRPEGRTWDEMSQ